MNLSCEHLDTVATRRANLVVFANDTSALTRSLRTYGEWAENELRFLQALVDNGATVLDVGAYVGTHTLAFSQFVGPTGQVVAVEAQAATFELLQRNVAQNRVANVRLIHAAAAAETGTMTIPFIATNAPGNFGSATLLDTRSHTAIVLDSGPERHGIVDTIAIDSLYLPACALIKIDAEGMEDVVLEGAASTLRRLRPIIYAECNSLERGLRSLTVLRAAGYSVFAHVVPAFNPDNFYDEQNNLFGEATEVALVAALGADTNRLRQYKLSPRELLLEVDGADDLALALLNKPQYPGEILLVGAAAKTGGAAYFDTVTHKAIENEHLRNENAYYRREIADREGELNRLRTENERIQNENAYYRREIAGKEGELNNLRVEFADLRQKLAAAVSE